MGCECARSHPSEVPPFDALYLDMNGIIHNCTHGDPSDEAFQLTEDQMFKDIGDYISTLFRIIKPRMRRHPHACTHKRTHICTHHVHR